MKKFIALVLTFTILVLFVGCQNNQSKGVVLKAWSGEFSEEKLEAAIKEYQSNYTTINLGGDRAVNISFETDFETSSCSVIRLSPANDANIDIELHSYIDLSLETSCQNRTVIVPVNWWYTNDNSRLHDHSVWSYLVRVTDTNGSNHYYYFRVNYSAYG